MKKSAIFWIIVGFLLFTVVSVFHATLSFVISVFLSVFIMYGLVSGLDALFSSNTIPYSWNIVKRINDFLDDEN